MSTLGNLRGPTNVPVLAFAICGNANQISGGGGNGGGNGCGGDEDGPQLRSFQWSSQSYHVICLMTRPPHRSEWVVLKVPRTCFSSSEPQRMEVKGDQPGSTYHVTIEDGAGLYEVYSASRQAAKELAAVSATAFQHSHQLELRSLLKRGLLRVMGQVQHLNGSKPVAGHLVITPALLHMSLWQEAAAMTHSIVHRQWGVTKWAIGSEAYRSAQATRVARRLVADYQRQEKEDRQPPAKKKKKSSSSSSSMASSATTLEQELNEVVEVRTTQSRMYSWHSVAPGVGNGLVLLNSSTATTNTPLPSSPSPPTVVVQPVPVLDSPSSPLQNIDWTDIPLSPMTCGSIEWTMSPLSLELDS
jgi:hypothetical protein